MTTTTTTTKPTAADYERLTSTWKALRQVGAPAKTLSELLNLANMSQGFLPAIRQDGRFALVGLE